MGHVLFLRKGLVHTAPVAGIRAGSLAVGTVVKLMEDSGAVKYRVVHQGKPSDLYDDSCDGTWLLRENVHSNRAWGESSKVNSYSASIASTYLNGDFFSSFGSVEQAAIKQVKIPYHDGRGDYGSDESGANGLPCKVFLLGMYELGFSTSDNKYIPVDGAKLDYFGSGDSTDADRLRIAYLDGNTIDWWTRAPYKNDNKKVWLISATGTRVSTTSMINSRGIRPALILPKTAKFDKDTLLLKGAS